MYNGWSAMVSDFWRGYAMQTGYKRYYVLQSHCCRGVINRRSKVAWKPTGRTPNLLEQNSVVPFANCKEKIY